MPHAPAHNLSRPAALLAQALAAPLQSRAWETWPIWATWLAAAWLIVLAALAAWRLRPAWAMIVALVLAAGGGAAAFASPTGLPRSDAAWPALAALFGIALATTLGIVRQDRTRRRGPAVWAPQLVALTADVLRLRAECNQALADLGRQVAFAHSDELLAMLGPCMRQAVCRDDFARAAVALHALTLASVRPSAWPDHWPEDKALAMPLPQRQQFVNDLHRLGGWGHRVLTGRIRVDPIAAILKRWSLSPLARPPDPNLWRQAQLALVRQCVDYLEEIRYLLAEQAAEPCAPTTPPATSSYSASCAAT